MLKAITLYKKCIHVNNKIMCLLLHFHISKKIIFNSVVLDTIANFISPKIVHYKLSSILKSSSIKYC